MAGIVGLFGAVGALVGGALGMLLAFINGGAMNLWACRLSDRMAMWMHIAREVDDGSAPMLYRMVRDLAQRARLPTPRVHMIDEDQPYAFAAWRNPDMSELISRLHAIARGTGR